MIFFYRKKFVSVYGIEIGSILNSLVGYQPYSKVMCQFSKYKWESGKLASENSVPYLNLFLPKFSKTKWEF